MNQPESKLSSKKKVNFATTVFIIASHLMFGRGLEGMLRQETDLEIVGQEANNGLAIEQIKALRPNVVIVYGDDESEEFKSTVVDVLTISPKSRVIGLNLQNNISYIYQAARWVIEDVGGLVEVVKNDFRVTNLSNNY